MWVYRKLSLTSVLRLTLPLTHLSKHDPNSNHVPLNWKHGFKMEYLLFHWLMSPRRHLQPVQLCQKEGQGAMLSVHKPSVKCSCMRLSEHSTAHTWSVLESHPESFLTQRFHFRVDTWTLMCTQYKLWDKLSSNICWACGCVWEQEREAGSDLSYNAQTLRK